MTDGTDKPRRAARPRPEPPPVEVLVEEGMLIAGSALRLAIKNLIIVAAFREGDAASAPVLRLAVRDRLLELARERQVEAARLERAREGARGRRGPARSQDDYREEDAPTLILRAEVNRLMARRLRQCADDDEYLDAQLTVARRAALDDILRSKLPAVAPVDDDEHGRRERMAAVRRDVERLHRERRRRPLAVLRGRLRHLLRRRTRR
ncbi:hypothetical protein CLV46_0595 [Diaminobutyricimonas aerilata]|uniref:Asparagine synthase n=1 Tax=Diaminobutyricimonas aerilata TaxID=1162967 RepID=A0A2M9CGQ5_9MICO|nr:hypothetical protein [Diaminobutyricimonas aerilata]PJJ71058.1 hypothetical protein CLV46_0595 [Diaminobutyricimonas aerilata]